ncbi:MAG: transposase, partial [Candidatus Heimdallarchaeota archaeon]|nr:transposase [Candidatus Heimdallarchaeota archaeon]
KSSVEWGQTVVDMVLVTDRVLEVDYQVYLPQKYLTRTNRTEKDFSTKIKLTEQLFDQHFKRLRAQNIPAKKIWVSVDCWYPSEDLITTFRLKEVKISMGLKKDTRCNLFGKFHRIDQVFNLKGPWKHRTNKRSGNKVFFQEKSLNLARQGRCKVFAVRRGEEKRIRYYGTNDLQISFNRFLERLTAHWQVETMHHDIKQYFGFDKCVTGSEDLNNLHWNLCYLVYLLFRRYQYNNFRKGISLTIPRLFELYCYQYDEKRALKCFSTPLKRSFSRQCLVGGFC